MNQLIYDKWTFLDDAVIDGNPFREVSLDSSALALDTLTVTVKCNDPGIVVFKKNSPVRLLRDGVKQGTYFLQSVARVGADRYELSCASALSILTQRPHAGGIYTGQAVKDVVAELFGDLPVLVESVYANTPLYGWLPFVSPPTASARDNLAQILFAIGANLRTDLNGVLRIEKLWDGETSSIPADRTYIGGTVQYDSPISSVSATEHQYIPGTEEATLFEGTAETGYLITFSEPMHTLTSDGFEIIASGANWATVSAGAGKLTGLKYVHNTRQVTQTVTDGSEENVISVTDKTLVSVTNSVAIAQRLAEYYRCRATVEQGVIAGAECPGHVVRVYDPFDRKMVTACIQSLDTELSATLKSEMTALIGFKPQQPQNAEYFNTRVLLTGNGTLPKPEGATSLTAVLIQGGQGAGCGHPGGNSTQRSLSWTTPSLGLNYRNTGYWATGGKGGEAGLSGAGGKILTITVALTDDSDISYSCGVGGEPTAYDPDNTEAVGTEGTHSTLTIGGVTYTSADGNRSDSGYTDPVTGEVFAAKGAAGVAGGDGSGMSEEYYDLSAYDSTIPTPAGNVVDADGNVWHGGSYTKRDETGVIDGVGDSANFDGNLDHGTVRCGASTALGSGAAVGRNGLSALTACGRAYASRNSDKTEITAYAWGCDGLAGASASAPAVPVRYGTGGTSGNGGGGGSAPGYAYVAQGGSPIGSVTVKANPGAAGAGGDGSQGSAGAPGCIILFFHQEQQVAAGPLVTSDIKWLLDSLGRRFIV